MKCHIAPRTGHEAVRSMVNNELREPTTEAWKYVRTYDAARIGSAEATLRVLTQIISPDGLSHTRGKSLLELWVTTFIPDSTDSHP